MMPWPETWKYNDDIGMFGIVATVQGLAVPVCTTSVLPKTASAWEGVMPILTGPTS